VSKNFQEHAKWAVLMISLFLILGGLAALQYRWSKRLAEAIQARVDTSLKASLMDWHLSLLRQITEPCFAMQIDSEPDSKEDWNKYYRRYEDWLKTAKFPGMFANLYLIRVSKEKRDEVYRFDTDRGRFFAAHWGPSFENLEKELRHQSANREALERQMTDDPHTKIDNAPGAMPHDPLFGWQFEQTLPALVHPLIHSDLLTDPRDRKFKKKSFNEREEEDGDDDHDADNIEPASWIVIELDPKVLQQQVLPELAQHYFGGPQSSNYDYAVVAGHGGKVLYASDPRLVQRPFDDADVVLDIFGPPPADDAPLAHDYAGDFHVDGETKPTPVEERRNLAAPMWLPVLQDIPADTHWNLIVRHRAGFLDAQMGAMRQRDLAIGLGILLLLGVSTGILIIATRRAQRLAQLQMGFVATVSHELRTPLAVICSAADNLSAGIVTDTQKIIKYGQTIKGEGKHLVDLVERILLFASSREPNQRYRLELLDINKIVALLTANTSGLLSLASVQLDVHVDPNTPQVLGDIAAISQCLQNLIINAVKYGGEAKWIGLSVRRIDIPTSREIQFAVQDRGMGIAPSDLPYIFEPFYRSPVVAAAQIRGTGLGLPLARNIAAAMGGSLTVQSELGKGCTFILHLPFAQDSPLRSAMEADLLGSSIAGTA
jgi:two-component system sensor histidine kinase SenX3